MYLEWSLSQWLLAVVSFALIVAYLLAGMRSSAGLTLRRLSAVCVFGALTSSIHFMLGGAQFSIHREVNLLASCATDMQTIKRAAFNLAPDAAPRIIGFSKSKNQCETFKRRVTTSTSFDMVDTFEIVSEAPEKGIFLDFIQFAVDKPFIDSRSFWNSFIHLFGRRTFVFLYEPNDPAWNVDLGLGQASITDLLAVSSLAYIESFVYQANDQSTPFKMRFELFGSASAGEQFEYANLLTNIRVHGPLNYKEDEIKINLCLSLNAATNLSDCEQRATQDVPHKNKLEAYFDKLTLHADPLEDGAWIWRQDPTTQKPQLLIDLLDLAVENEYKSATSPSAFRLFREEELPAGWHSLHVDAELILDNDSLLPLPPRSVFFEVENNQVTIITGKTDLFNASWPVAPNPSSVEYILRKLFGVSNPANSSALGLNFSPRRFDGLSLNSSCLLDLTSSMAEIETCLASSKALVLFEPDRDLLRSITSSNIPQEFTERGGSVLVIAPPTLESTDVALKDWLPAWAKGNTPDPMRVFVDRELVLIGDCGLLSFQAIKDSTDEQLLLTAERPIDFQFETIEKILNKLQGNSDWSASNFSGATISAGNLSRFESKQQWRPAAEINKSMGCSKPKLPDTPSKSDLFILSDPRQKISAFVADRLAKNKQPFADFQGNDYHPGSVIVVFSTPMLEQNSSLAESLETRSTSGAGQSNRIKVAPVSPSLIKDLSQKGVKVIIVELPTNNLFHDAAAKARWTRLISELKGNAQVVYIPASFHNNKTDVLVQKLLNIIDAHWASSERHIKILERSRVLDTRLRDIGSLMPSNYILLEKSTNTTSILETRSVAPISSTVQADTLIEEARLNNGRVVTTAFHPFAPYLLSSDILDPLTIEDLYEANYSSGVEAQTWLKSFLALDRVENPASVSSGLGPQRLVDIIDLTAKVSDSNTSLKLIGIEIGDEQTDIEFRFKIPPGLNNWPSPSIILGQAAQHCISVTASGGCELTLTKLDPLKREVSYRFNTFNEKGLEANNTGHKIIVSPTNTLNNFNVKFELLKKEKLNRLPGERLLGLISGLGGSKITTQLPQAFLPSSMLSAVAILVLTLFLFSPFVRPWTAFNRWRRRFAEADKAPTIGFDPEVVSQRMAEHLSRYEASRRSGDPAWTRRYAPGDSLTRALAADLFSFLPQAKRLGIPKLPPRVRLREAGEGFDFYLCVDDSQSMFHPGHLSKQSKKVFALKSLIDILGRSIDIQGGRWYLCSLRGRGLVGPVKGQDKALIEATIDSWITDQQETLDLDTIPEVARHAIILVISDFATNLDHEYLSLFEGNFVRALMITDPEESQEIGMSYDAVSGKIYDRSEWEPGDVRSGQQARRLNLCTQLEFAGHKCTEIDVEISNVELAETLISSNVLQTAGNNF